jgi:hypothetical protein
MPLFTQPKGFETWVVVRINRDGSRQDVGRFLYEQDANGHRLGLTEVEPYGSGNRYAVVREVSSDEVR